MTEVTMAYLIESAGQLLAVDIRHQICPQSYLGTIEGRLSDDAFGTVASVSQQYIVSLVGYIAQEVALQHGCGTFQLRGFQLLIAVEHGVQLLLERQPVSHSMYHDVVFCYLATREAE